MKQEDAINTIVNWIREGCPSQYSKYGYEVYLSNLIIKITEIQKEQKEVSTVIYDAAWELCRRGILRPGIKQAGGQATNDGGYCLTYFGRQWIKEGNQAFVPTEPERFGEMLAPFKTRFGPGYFDRAQQAIRCYGAHTYLACCAMCGAAAESILLATAITKAKGDEEGVLKVYRTTNGRGITFIIEIAKNDHLIILGVDVRSKPRLVAFLGVHALSLTALIVPYYQLLFNVEFSKTRSR